MNAGKCFIGIDVSKRTLDIHLRPMGEKFGSKRGGTVVTVQAEAVQEIENAYQ